MYFVSNLLIYFYPKAFLNIFTAQEILFNDNRMHRITAWGKLSYAINTDV